MLEINSEREGTRLTVYIKGRVDSSNVSDFDRRLRPELSGITEFILDCAELDYLSSAGLRTVLHLHQKVQDKGGTMRVRNVSKDVFAVLEICGFLNFLTLDDETEE